MVLTALRNAPLTGHVLELAAGTGIWSREFVTTADTLTLVDGSAQMLAHNPVAGNSKVTIIQADLFQWQPAQKYHAIGFTFWLSHVPREALGSFIRKIAAWLHPGGRIFFLDSQQKKDVTAPHILSRNGQLMRRKLNDGSEATIIKNYYNKEELETICLHAGITANVTNTPEHFQYGFGVKNTTI